MKSQRNIPRQFFGLTLTLVGLMSWTLPVHLPERAVQAATRARVTEPIGQPVSRAVANGRIAFVSSEGNAQSDIYTMNPDGSDRKQLTFSQESEGGPVWSPDGTKIAFVRYNSSFGEIFVMNADGTNHTRTSNPVLDDSFDWSPDSARIVFQSFHGGSFNIANISVMNADGTNQTRFSAGGGNPRWSPDGTKIVFVSGFASSNEICVMNADGSNVQRLTNNQAFDSSPKWSPDGSKITFIRCGGSNGFGCSTTPNLWGVSADGSNPTKLTDTQAWDHAWSPDGTKIILWGPGSGAADLFVMNPDGSGLTNITNTTGKYEASPSWQPISSSACTNPIDCADFLVRQHYRDFLNREADPEGLAFWTNEITSCGANAHCIEVKRINDSGSFFHSIEFQETGYLAYRMYKAAYGDLPNAPVPIKLDEFLPDTQRIGQGVIVRHTGWEQVLENNKRNFALEFVQRARFTSAFSPTMSAAELVDKLNRNARNPLSQTERDHLVSDLSSGARSRADVLRAVAENRNLVQAEFNRAFVLMQYFGYLRRNPNDAPDGNFVGYNFWLDKLNQFSGNFIDAEMVKAFITSIEYRRRFGP